VLCPSDTSFKDALDITLTIRCSVEVLPGPTSTAGIHENVADEVAMGDDILTAITQHLNPLAAAGICQAARKAALEARSCTSIYELKLVLAVDKCTCVRERVDFVNLAIEHGVCCRLYYGPLLQPHATGDAYGPSQLVTLECRRGDQAHVVPVERSVNLLLHRPDETLGGMVLAYVRIWDTGGMHFRFRSFEFNDFSSMPWTYEAALSHHGDHTSRCPSDAAADTLWEANRPRSYADDPADDDKYWERMTYVTIASEEEGPIDLVTSDSDSDNA